MTPSPSDRLRLRTLTQTCAECPSQWEGTLEDGRHVYVRYRWGLLTWGIGDTIDAAVQESIGARPLTLGGEFDGLMDTDTMLCETGLLAPACASH